MPRLLVVNLASSSVAVLLGSAVLILVGVDLVGRLVLRLLAPAEQSNVLYGVCVYGVLLAVVAALGFWWVRQYRLSRVWVYLAIVATPASVLIGVLGPWVSGQDLAADGGRLVVLRMLLTLVVVAAGAIAGVLSAVALGRDLTSQAWQVQAQNVHARGRASKKPG